jgi:DeoR-like helix-turn-helix domain
MGRNSELIRQGTLLQKVAAARDHTIAKLAAALGVSTRTIRRDLAACRKFTLFECARGVRPGSDRGQTSFRRLAPAHKTAIKKECSRDVVRVAKGTPIDVHELPPLASDEKACSGPRSANDVWSNSSPLMLMRRGSVSGKNTCTVPAHVGPSLKLAASP